MKISVLGFGKINLFLDIIQKRNDGYHAVNMIMQGVRLADQVYLENAEKFSITSTSPYVPNNEKNIALKSALLMSKIYGLPPVRIYIEKNIPVSAGMAGGSSDAAAVILGMDYLFGLNRPLVELMHVAQKIGSDVPFCLYSETALAVGRGEIIAPLLSLPKFHIVICKANFGVSTATIYGGFRSRDMTVSHEQMIANICSDISERNLSRVLEQLYNSLEPVTFSMYPKVREIKEKMISNGARHVLMSGSGPTVFAAFEREEEAWTYYKKIQNEYRYVHLTSTVSAKDLLERIQVISE